MDKDEFFDAIYRVNSAKIIRFAYRYLGDMHIANDVMQEVFLIAYVKIADLMKGNFSNANIEAKVNEYKAMIDPEMDAQFEKWGGSRNKWEQYINTFLSNIKGNKKTLIEDLKEYFGLSSSEISAYFGEVDIN